MTAAPDDPPLFAFFNEIGIIEQLARNRFEQVMPHGMTLPQFTVLNHFVRLGGEYSPLALARAFQVSKGTMTNTLQRLEGKGLIAIRPDPEDGRAKIVAITEAGRAARADAIAALAPALREMAQDFTTEEIAAALPLLSRMRAWLDRDRDRRK